MSAEPTAVAWFLQSWTEEFTRAVEMFSGQVPSLRSSLVKKLTAADADDLFWWKQDFAGAGRFATWIGIKKETITALGGGADVAAEEAKSTFLEMLGQAQSGAAHVLSAGFETPLKCETGGEGKAPDLDSLLYGIVGITFDSNELPSLLFAFEPSIEPILIPEELLEAEPAAASSTGPNMMIAAANQPMLSRLMELELPLSIALGRAMMPIREVLKVTTGSVIELDRNVGDSVELLVHGTVVARGEVVSVKGNYGVRIKEIISQQDRMHLYKRD